LIEGTQRSAPIDEHADFINRQSWPLLADAIERVLRDGLLPDKE